MSSMINTNINSLVAQNNLNTSQSALATSIQRLSSGLRINSAKDDAAGLAVSTLMNAQVKSINQAVRNANDGISMLQTAEGGIQEQQNMLTRMRELAVQGASGTISDTDRSYINTELQALKAEINGIADRTVFNGQKLLTGNLGVAPAITQTTATSTALVGTALNTTKAAMITAIDVSGAKASTYTFSNDDTGTSTALTLTRADNVKQTINVTDLAPSQSEDLDFSALGIKITIQAGVTGKTGAQITEDMGGNTTDLVTALHIVAAAGANVPVTTADIQVGANAGDTTRITFNNTKIDTTGNLADQKMADLNAALKAFDPNDISGTGASTTANASLLLDAIDGAIGYTSGLRSDLGANMNRLGHTVANLESTSTNISAAASRITDADFASETAAMTRANILQQAGTAMLAQANSLPNGVMALLQRL